MICIAGLNFKEIIRKAKCGKLC